jgi:hypothetical protein
MASVPLSVEQLEQIVQVVAHNLLEKWAIDDRFTEEQITEYAQHAVDDTVFVINNYMDSVNTVMLEQAEQIGVAGTTPGKLELI